MFELIQVLTYRYRYTCTFIEHRSTSLLGEKSTNYNGSFCPVSTSIFGKLLDFSQSVKNLLNSGLYLLQSCMESIPVVG